MKRIPVLLPALLLLLLPLCLPARAAAQVAPDVRWSTFETEHFRVHFHGALEPFARRAAARAERAHALLSAELSEPPAGRIDLVLADNVDYANGYATPIPGNRVVVYAHPPSDSPSLGYYEDWLDLVILHELVHIFHLDQAGGVWDRLRDVFGRSPILFPQAFTSGAVVEGLATYYESALTGRGRVLGSYQEMVLRTAILEDRFFPVERGLHDPVTWPGPSTRYVYGSMFLDHLARTRGREAVREFVERYGRQLVPFRLDRVARGSFGVSLSRAWSEWEDSLRHRYAALADSVRARGLTVPERLTHHARQAAFPRFHPGGEGVVYAAATGRDQPALRWIGPDGAARGIEGVTTLGPSTWLPGGRELLYAQIEFTDPHHARSDLYRFRVGGGETRLTRGARVWDPSAHPDGTRVVAVSDAAGTNVLVVHELASGETRALTAADPAVNWALPRWSPDGTRIAATRWSRDGIADVVLLDGEGRVIRELTADHALDTAPAWSPDGGWVVFSSDRSGISNLYAYDLRADRLLQVTNLLTGAFQPDVSPDGRWIVFSLYGAEGYDIARVPFDPARWSEAASIRPAVAPARPPLAEGEAGGPARSYSALRSLAPTAWELLADAGSELGIGVGAATFGLDVVERHFVAGSLLAYAEGGRVQAGGVYRYRGLGNPELDLFAVQNWSVDFGAGELQGPGGAPIASALLRREREVGAALRWRRQRWRSVGWAGVGAALLDAHREWDDPGQVQGVRLREIPLDLGGSLDAGYSSARGFGLSIGPQQGITLSATLEGHRFTEPIEGDDEPAGYTRLRGRARSFHPLFRLGWARHVLAVRADAGAERGSRAPGLRVGGTSGGGAPLPVATDLLGQSLAFPVRGFASGTQRGDRAVSATAEYRFPLALVERGFRALPLFLGRVYGDAFVDAGTAWCAAPTADCQDRFPGSPTAPDPLVSAGAELVAHLGLGFIMELPLRLGVAVPVRGEDPGAAAIYLRVGRAF